MCRIAAAVVMVAAKTAAVFVIAVSALGIGPSRMCFCRDRIAARNDRGSGGEYKAGEKQRYVFLDFFHMEKPPLV